MSNSSSNISGTCQICGRVQKVVRGRLANHGYSKFYGSHSGTCDGAGHPPVEAGKVTAFAWPMERAQLHIARNKEDLLSYEMPGYVWSAGVDPVKAVRSRHEGIRNCEAALKFYAERSAKVAAIIAAAAKVAAITNTHNKHLAAAEAR